MSKNSPQNSLIFKGITAFAFLVGIAFMLSFMNCSFNEEPIILDSQHYSPLSTQLPSSFPPNPNPPNTNTNTTNTPTTTSDDCSNNAPQSQLSIVQQVATETADLYKTNVHQFTRYVAECLKDINPNWGRRIDDVGSLSGDTIAYYIGDNTDPYSVDIIDSSTPSNPQLAWLVRGTIDECGQVGGTWQRVDGECIIGQVESEPEEQCTQEQLDNDYATINEECLKTCDSFDDTNAEGVTIGKGEQCNDTRNYNILSIKNTFESELDEPQACCRRSPKRNCFSSSGYQLVVDNCQPTCAQAAKLAGYTTNYYLYTNKCSGGFSKFCTENCQELNKHGHKDWLDFTFYDPYNFIEASNNTEGHLYFSGDDDGCCIRASQDETPAQSYNSKGWHPDDY